MIRRDVALAPSGGIVLIEGRVCELSLTGLAPCVVLTELALLDQALVDELSFRDERNGFRLIFAKGVGITFPRVVVRERQIRMDVPETMLKYLMIFFLRYYQAGFPEVDHLDFEAGFNQESGGVFDLLVTVSPAPPTPS